MIEKIRAQQIIIDVPTETAEPWVRVTLQKVLKNADYNTVQTIDRVEFVHRQYDDFSDKTITAIDPVTNETVTVSGAGMASIITDAVRQWILADMPGTRINEHNDIIREEL